MPNMLTEKEIEKKVEVEEEQLKKNGSGYLEVWGCQRTPS